MRNQGLSKQIADLARMLDVLGDRLTAQNDGHALSQLERPRVDAATQALITELTRMVLQLQRNVDELRRTGPTARLVDVTPTNPAALAIERSAMAIDVASISTGLATTRTPSTADFEGRHGVHFSRSHEHAVAAIVDMIDDAFAHDRAAVVVATGLHRRWIEADLHQRCIAFEGDTLRLIDADTTLSSLLVDGTPDRDRFRSTMGQLLREMCARNPGGVSVYGEMVGILWSRGQAVGTMRLEELWNELQHELPFSLLCGYLIDGRPDSTDLEPIRHIHTYVA